jgi:hypothetical protein
VGCCPNLTTEGAKIKGTQNQWPVLCPLPSESLNSTGCGQPCLLPGALCSCSQAPCPAFLLPFHPGSSFLVSFAGSPC